MAAAGSRLAGAGKPSAITHCLHRIQVELGVQALGQCTAHAAGITQAIDDPALGIECLQQRRPMFDLVAQRSHACYADTARFQPRDQIRRTATRRGLWHLLLLRLLRPHHGGDAGATCANPGFALLALFSARVADLEALDQRQQRNSLEQQRGDDDDQCQEHDRVPGFSVAAEGLSGRASASASASETTPRMPAQPSMTCSARDGVGPLDTPSIATNRGTTSIQARRTTIMPRPG